MNRFVSIILGGLLLACTSIVAKNFTQYVNPYIGAGGHGHVFVGASVPFGAIQLGPSNIHKGWDWCSGYHYSDSVIIGFAHTHLNGTGCTDLGDVLLMPYMGAIRVQRGEQANTSNSYSTTYNHSNELVSPFQYSLLMDSGIKAELTSSERVGCHCYTFPQTGDDVRVIIDLKEGNGDISYDTYLKVIDDYTIQGYRFSKGWAPDQKVFFTLKSDKPFISVDLYNDTVRTQKIEIRSKGVKGILSYAKKTGSVKLKISISSVSCENALLNIEKEVSHWDFKRIAQNSKDKWNKELSKFEIVTSNKGDKEIFYTSLYHTFIAPTLYCDVNKQFRGIDDKIYSSSNINYSRFSLWDTYRAAHPLFTLTQPERVDDMINSMLSIFTQQGKLPIWPLNNGETNQMPGYSSIPVVVDAYLKGFKGFDSEKAFEACKASTTFRKQEGISEILDLGFIPCDSIIVATSIAMEYAMGDNSLAMMAKKMGKMDDYQYYQKKSLSFEKYFDENIGFIRPKMKDGSWRTPYNPIESIHIGDFCEGNGWQYTFFVPHNPERLIELMGGDAAFNKKLDSFFITEGNLGKYASLDITGLIGMYAHGNEPSHHICYLYSYSGQQWKTAEKINYIMDHFYSNQPDGLIGNEDCGQMSAWYILSSLGFYPVNSSNGCFVFGTPRFEEIILKLPKDRKFTVQSENLSSQNIYIQSVELNGHSYDKSYLHYEDIMKGGLVKFIMGNKPNYNFGSAKQHRPKSNY